MLSILLALALALERNQTAKPVPPQQAELQARREALARDLVEREAQAGGPGGCASLGADTAASHYLELLRRALVGATALFSTALLVERPDVAYGSNPRAAGVLQNGGWQRARNLQCLLDDLESRAVAGDFVECGVWRGGVVIFMAGYIRAHGLGAKRHVYGFDSFEGVPAAERSCAERGEAAERCREGARTRHAEDERGPHARFFTKPPSDLRVSHAQVASHVRQFNLSGLVTLTPGWFAETLPALGAEPRRIALLRVDGDLYSSTMTVLEQLYPRVSLGGWVVLDDWGIEMSRRAIADYRARHGIDEPLSFHSGPMHYPVARWRKAREVRRHGAGGRGANQRGPGQTVSS